MLDLFITLKCNGGHCAAIVPMVVPVGGVVSKNATVIARVDQMIDVSEVVSDHPASIVNPDLSSKNSAAFSAGWVELFIHGLLQAPSHDLLYHGWIRLGKGLY